MRAQLLSRAMALAALLAWSAPQLALAQHGHGGGGGGHHGGGGGHHGGMGSFSDGHHGGIGGHSGGRHGGYSGGHPGGMGAFRGGHESGMRAYRGGIHGGMDRYGIGNSGDTRGYSGSPPGSSAFGGRHYGGGRISGDARSYTLPGLSGSGRRHPGGSFMHRHGAVGSSLSGAARGLSRSAAGGAASLGRRALTGSAAAVGGTRARSLLSHSGAAGNHAAHFLRNHAVPSRTVGVAGHHHGPGGGGNVNQGRHHHFPATVVGVGYPFWPSYSLWPYGYGFGYSGYGYGYGGWPYYRYNAACAYVGYGGQTSGYAPTAVAAPPAQQPLAADIDSAKVFAEKGEADFRARDYKSAAYAWRHAVLDDPTNGVLLMLLAQSLFATEQFDEAAGATQQAMQLLPEEQWGVVVTNYKELYSKIGDYTRQLRSLEKAAKDATGTEAEAGLRFLLGFHYGYLGYPSQSVKQLDKVLELAATDQIAQKLRELMAAKLPESEASPSPAADPPADEPVEEEAAEAAADQP